MARDNAPVPHTCPVIDEVITAIDSIDWEDTSWNKIYLIKKMEHIRDANYSLRTWGNEKQDDCEKLEDKIEELEYKIESLSDELEDLKNKTE